MTGYKYREIAPMVRGDERFTRILREATERVSAEEASLLLLDEESDDLVFTATCSPVADKLIGMRQPLASGLVSMVFSSNREICVAAVAEHPSYDPSVSQSLGVHTREMMVVPLVFREEVVGVVTAHNRRRDGEDTSRPFGRRDLESYRPVVQELQGLLAEVTSSGGEGARV